VLPVDKRKQVLRFRSSSVEVMNLDVVGWKCVRKVIKHAVLLEMLTWHFLHASLTFSTLVSENPFMLTRVLVVVFCRDCENVRS
jgi:hypothetical protein